ncbi:MAG: DUF2116 family Zn-ribbon domain-containing protein [Daejeonella sp.]
MEKTCLDCHNPIKGRADKKFCDDQCRSNYNNRQKMDTDLYLKHVNQILKKNRNLLTRFNPDGKAKVKKAKLADSGFNFNFFTHIYETQKGQTYKFCYEYGYLELNAFELLLVKREEAV